MTDNMNAIMKALSIQAQTATSAVPPSTTPSETGQAAQSESTCVSGRSHRSGSHSGPAGGHGRREADASNKVKDASAAQNTTANSGSVAAVRKPTPAPKPKKQDSKADPVGAKNSELTISNKFDVLAGMDMEVESAPTLGGSGKSTTSPGRNPSSRKEDKHKK